MAFSMNEAFDKFKSNLELSKTETEDVQGKHKAIREFLNGSFSLDDDFLAGSYARWTKTKPLKDVDIICVLNPDKEKGYLNKPKVLLDDFRSKLITKYGKEAVPPVNFRSVTVEFIKDEDEAGRDKKVMSIDIVPSFAIGNAAYKIPDMPSNDWVKTNPQIHADLTTKANEKFDGEWKPLVKMIKKWNEFNGKPIKPSFLIEVMALDILCPPFSA